MKTRNALLACVFAATSIPSFAFAQQAGHFRPNGGGLSDPTVPGQSAASPGGNTVMDGYQDDTGQYRPGAPDQAQDTSSGRGSVNVSGGYDGDGNSYNGPSVSGGGGAGGDDGNSEESQADRERELLEAVRTLLPPDKFVVQARRVKKSYEHARVEPLSQPAHPVTRSIAVTLRPHEAIPTIALEYGVVTTLTFADSTGAPWNVKGIITDTNQYGYTGGSSDKGSASNIITIYPKTEYSVGRNIAVMLDKGRMPFIANLKTGENKDVDYRVDVSILQHGPDAKEEVLTEGISPTDDRVMDEFIDDVAPKHAHKLHTSSDSVEAWKLKQNGQSMYYIRTTMSLLSPGFVKRSHSNLSGSAVYCIQETPSIILGDASGHLTSVNIED